MLSVTVRRRINNERQMEGKRGTVYTPYSAAEVLPN